MKRKAVMTIFALVCISAVASVASALSGQNAYDSAMRALTEGDIPKAIELFTQALAANPQDHRALNDRGIAYKRSGELDRALDDFSRALRIKPDYPHAFNNRGLVHLDRGNVDAAVRDFGEALRHGGSKSKIHTNLGIAKAKKGDHRAAVKEFEIATSAVPVDIRSYLYMGESLEQLGARDLAVRTYRVALSATSDADTAKTLEKKIADLAKPETPQKPETTAASGVAAPGPATEGKSVQRREVVRAQPVVEAIKPVAEVIKPVQEPKPAAKPQPSGAPSVDALDQRCRTRALEKFAANSAEIYRQGVQFLLQGDAKKALIRFEDTLQIEKRRKNNAGSAWCLLEIGRAYRSMGDHRKAEENLDSANRFFKRNQGMDEVILALVEMAAAKKAASQADKAAALYAEAAREAETRGDHQLALAITGLASGRSQISGSEGSVHPQKAEPVAAPAKTEKPFDEAPKAQQMPPADNQGQPAPSGPTDRPQEPTAAKASPTVAKAEEPPSQAPEPRPAPSPADAKRKILAWGMASKPSLATPGPGPQPQKPLPTLTPRVAETQPGEPIRSVVPAAPALPAKEARAVPTAALPPVDDTPPEKPVPTPAAAPPSPRPAAIAKPVISAAEKAGPRRNVRQYLGDLKKYRDAGDEFSMIYVLERLAEAYAREKEPAKAYHCLLASLAFREKLAVTKGAEKLYRERGLIREKLGDFCGALEDLTRAMYHAELDRSVEDMRGIALRAEKLAGSIGLDTSSTLPAYRTLWQARARGDEKAETDALYLLGKVYDKAERTSDALAYYDRSTASLLANKARMYEKVGKKDLADKAYNDALEAFKKLDYSRYLNMLKNTSIVGQFSFQ